MLCAVRDKKSLIIKFKIKNNRYATDFISRNNARIAQNKC